MTTYRIARPEERQVYIDFADMVFQTAGTDIHFDHAIPKVYGEGVDSAHMQHIAVEESGSIRGLVAVLPGTLHLPDATLQTGFIGTVSVHPEARGEGHMKRLMHDAVEDARKAGCDLLLLGGQRQRYEYFGFVQAGLQWRYGFERRTIRHGLAAVDASGVSFAEILPGSPEEKAAETLHRARRVWRGREEPGFAVVCRTYEGTPFAILEGGRVTGFLVMSTKPESLWDLCVKDTAALDRAIKAWMEQRELKNLTFTLPDWEQETRLHLNAWCESVSCAASEQVRILNYRRVVEAFLKLKASYAPLADGEQGFLCEGQRFTVQVKGGVPAVAEGAADPLEMDTLDMQRALLSPFPMTGRRELPAGWAPLPVFSCPPDDF